LRNRPDFTASFYEVYAPEAFSKIAKIYKENKQMGKRQLLIDFFKFFQQYGEAHIGISIQSFVDVFLKNRKDWPEGSREAEELAKFSDIWSFAKPEATEAQIKKDFKEFQKFKQSKK
jgi:hypothetical protein